MTPSHLSRETYERLSTELQELTTVGRTRIAQAIEAARNLGDLSENGDYHAAKDEQGRMEGRIRQLQAMLENAEIVEDAGPTEDRKSTRLNSSHANISYAVFCLKKKKTHAADRGGA